MKKYILMGGVALFAFALSANFTFAATVDVYNLQPSYTATGGGGVWSSYQGPPTYNYVSPGVTANYDGFEAAPIYAGVTIDPTDSIYEDQGLFAFKPGETPISTFATQPLTYDFKNETGTAPVWVYIELNKGVTGDIMYQYVPTSNPASWHTEDAATGTHWQAWTNLTDGETTGPMLSLADIAAANPGKTVSRVYLTEGMGDAYNVSPGIGTFAWVDKVTIGDVTYDFVVAANVTTDAATYVTSTGATLNGTNGTSDATNTSFWWGTSAPGSTIVPSNDPNFAVPSGWSHDDGLGSALAGGTFSEPLAGLIPGTTYHFVAWSQIGGVWYPGAVLDFTTAAALIGPPTNKDQCKNGGWETFTDHTFKNQGECVSYVQSNPNAGKRP